MSNYVYNFAVKAVLKIVEKIMLNQNALYFPLSPMTEVSRKTMNLIWKYMHFNWKSVFLSFFLSVCILLFNVSGSFYTDRYNRLFPVDPTACESV